MNYRFKNNPFDLRRLPGFTLVETIAAVVVVGILCSGVLVVFIRCTSAVRDSVRKTQAFEVARENMEVLLAAGSVTEKTEYGYSEKYPGVQWMKKVETFYEPVRKDMWVRAVSSAEYEDSKGRMRSVELTHWLTKVSEKQQKKIEQARAELEARAAELGISPEELLEQEQAPPRVQELPPLPEDVENMTADELEKWLNETAGQRN